MSPELAEQLLRLIRVKACRAAAHCRRGVQDSEELLQDIFLAVLRKLPQFDPGRSSLRTFVARVTEHALIDLARRKAAERRNPSRHGGEDWTSSASLDRIQDSKPETDKDLVFDLQMAIERLPPDLQTLASDLQQWSADEIAEREDVHRGTIYRRIARLRERWEDSALKDYLNPDSA